MHHKTNAIVNSNTKGILLYVPSACVIAIKTRARKLLHYVSNARAIEKAVALLYSSARALEEALALLW